MPDQRLVEHLPVDAEDTWRAERLLEDLSAFVSSPWVTPKAFLIRATT